VGRVLAARCYGLGGMIYDPCSERIVYMLDSAIIYERIGIVLGPKKWTYTHLPRIEQNLEQACDTEVGGRVDSRICRRTGPRSQSMKSCM
jgi:hypothetical protein